MDTTRCTDRLPKGASVDDFVKQLMDKTGIDEKTADKVIDFIKDHLDDVLGMFTKEGSALDSVGDALGGLLGGKKK